MLAHELVGRVDDVVQRAQLDLRARRVAAEIYGPVETRRRHEFFLVVGNAGTIDAVIDALALVGQCFHLLEPVVVVGIDEVLHAHLA